MDGMSQGTPASQPGGHYSEASEFIGTPASRVRPADVEGSQAGASTAARRSQLGGSQPGGSLPSRASSVRTPRSRTPAGLYAAPAHTIRGMPHAHAHASPATAMSRMSRATPRSAHGSRSGRDVSDAGTPLTVTAGKSGLARDTGTDPFSALSVPPGAMIWGTTIVLSQTMEMVQEFLTTFRLPKEDGRDDVDEDDEPLYLRQLREVLEADGRHLDVDAGHILAWRSEDPDTRRPRGEKLYGQLVRYPQEVVPIFDIAVTREVEHIRSAFLDMDADNAPDDEPMRKPLRVRVFNLATQRRMRDLDPSDLDTLISVRGMVTRTSAPIPDMRSAFYRCSNCNLEEEVLVERGRVDDPTICRNCDRKFTFQLIHNRCTFMDKQYVKVQETPESVPEGETPQTVLIYAFEDLCDSVVPGDRVEITGIYRAIPLRVNPRQRTVKSIFKTYIDAVHFWKVDKARLASEDPAVASGEFAVLNPHMYSVAGRAQSAAFEQRKQRVLTMSATPDLYAALARSLAPSIWEMDDVKKGVLLQLFGGVVKDLGKEGKMRGEINILLVGDPGVAKSQLLSYVHKVSARGIYTSGKGSSAVGLTASIIKDPETREPVLESGALVLSDRGVCAIDEFDKMSDTTRVILHEVMEQQTVSIAKAGIIATLNARTSILAAANPIESRYNPKLSVVENLQLPPTLLSRFDLIYLLLDPERADTDRELARHLVALYGDPRDRPGNAAVFSVAQLTEYISYAKAHVDPRLSDDAVETITRSYVDMRRAGSLGGRKTIAATTRQLESVIRLSEAHARMRLSQAVEDEDVAEAVRLIHVATQRAAIDPRTGTINMDLLTTGHTAEEREAVDMIAVTLRDMLSARPRNFTTSVSHLVKELSATTDVPISSEEVLEALRELASEAEPIVRVQGQKVTVVA